MPVVRGVYCPRPRSLLLRPSLLAASGSNPCAYATLGKTPLQVPGFLPTSLLPTAAPTTCNQLCRLRRCNIFGRSLLKSSSMWCGLRSWRSCSGAHAVSVHVPLSVFPFSALHRSRCVFGKPTPHNNGHSLGFMHVRGNSASVHFSHLHGTTSTASRRGCELLWVGLASLLSLPVVFSSMKKCCSLAMPYCFPF